MTGTLRPDREDDARFLAARTVAFCWDDAGIGKTPQAIRAADLAGHRRMLIVCPALAEAAE